MTVEEQVLEIVADKLGVDGNEVSREKSFIEDLGADSLDITELMMSFEEVFGVESRRGCSVTINGR